MAKWSGNVSTSDASSHEDCNRSGTMETVKPDTGEVESSPCGGCGGNGTVATPTDRMWTSR